MKKFAAFDIDGTLIRWQLYHAVVDKLAKKGLLGPDAEKQLNQARMKWKRRQHKDSFSRYETSLIAIFEAAFGSLSAKQFDLVTQEVIDEYGDQTYIYTRELIKKLKKKGYILLAISGSQQEVVEHVAKLYGFTDWVGTNYKRRNDRFSSEPFVASQHKKEVLESLIKKHGLEMAGSIGIGDSGNDADILAMVEQPIAFNPDQKLYNSAKKNGWKIVIERKNVIYRLEADNGSYILA
ncbi:MAG: HAD family phosphatase [Candidatus Saccharibacteria bacterium]